MPITEYAWFPALLAMLSLSGVLGWVVVSWMKMRHGYPIENMWGRPMLPASSTEATERLRMLTQENAQLRAELGSVKDRLATVERIVTDSSYRLDAEIATLRTTN